MLKAFNILFSFSCLLCMLKFNWSQVQMIQCIRNDCFRYTLILSCWEMISSILTSWPRYFKIVASHHLQSSATISGQVLFLFCFGSYYLVYFDDWDCYAVQSQWVPLHWMPKWLSLLFYFTVTIHIFHSLLTLLICFVCCCILQTYWALVATRRTFQW